MRMPWAQKAFVLIPSDGWIGAINNSFKLRNDSFENDKTLHLPYSPDLKKKFGNEFYVSFLNFRDFGINGDNFILECDLMNSAEEGGVWAYDVSLDIIGKSNNINFNLLSPEATMYAALNVADSDFNSDLASASLGNLGVDLSFWRHLKLEVKDSKFQIILDNEVLIDEYFEGAIGDLVGLQFLFKGCGFVRNVTLKDLKKIIEL